MRTRLVLGVLGCLAAAHVVLARPASAREMKPTIYGDGRSCPGNCDAHVVLHPSDNGTRYAFAPSSSRSAPAKCQAGQPCRICFGEPDNTCMTVLYRGAGPERGRFDFTSAFYDANCGRPGIPTALARQYSSMDGAAQSLGYRGSWINCFAPTTRASGRSRKRSGSRSSSPSRSSATRSSWRAAAPRRW
jgi:hypothetical protein